MGPRHTPHDVGKYAGYSILLLLLMLLLSTATSSEKPSYSVWPLYGPVAGGTRLTIIGQYLQVSTVTAVFIGQHQALIDNHTSVQPANCIVYVIFQPNTHILDGSMP